MIKINGKDYELIPVETDSSNWSPFGSDGPFAGDIITRRYKCPLCGKGLYVHVEEDTPGDRDSYSYLDCKNCDPDRIIYVNDDFNSWDLRKRTEEEIQNIMRIRKKYGI